MSGLFWVCPGCGASVESEGRDESSRASVATFRRGHRACVSAHSAEVLSGECDPDKEHDVARESGDDPFEQGDGEQ